MPCGCGGCGGGAGRGGKKLVVVVHIGVLVVVAGMFVFC